MNIIKLVEMSGSQYIGSIILIFIIIAYIYKLMTASAVERFMFPAKDKLAFKAVNNFIMYITIVIIVLVYGSLLKKIIINEDSIPSLFYFGIPYLVIIISARFLTSVKYISNIITWLNSNKILQYIAIGVMLFIVLYPILCIMALAYNRSEQINVNVRIVFTILIACILSLFALILFLYISRPVITFKKNYLYISLDNKVTRWYLIKRIDNDVLLGDQYSEESCSMYMLIDREKLKNIKVYIEKSK